MYDPKERRQMSKKLSIKEILNADTFEMPERSLSAESLDDYGVRSIVSQQDGETVTDVCFPSYSKSGSIVGYNILNVDGSSTKWTATGQVKISNKLFGQEVAEKISRKRKRLYITEGQIDCISVYQALCDASLKWAKSVVKPFVVSIPMGTANAVDSIINNIDFVSSFEEVVLVMDNDKATDKEKRSGTMKGEEAREALASALLGEVKVLTATPSQGMKDPSDYLQSGKEEDLVKLLSFNLQEYSPVKVLDLEEVTTDSLRSKKKRGVDLEVFPILNSLIDSFRTGEITLLIAPVSAGKTTATENIMTEFMKKGYKCGGAFLEETKEDTLLRFIAYDLGVNNKDLRNDPEMVSAAEFDKSLRVVKDEWKPSLVAHFGSMPINELLGIVRYMVLVEKVKFFFLDHLSIVLSGNKSDDKVGDIDAVMTELGAFASSHDVHIVVVSHIKRGGFKPPSKEQLQSEEPYFLEVDMEAGRGSSALEGIAFNIIMIEKEVIPGVRKRGRSRLVVGKSRWGRDTGVADVFSIDRKTGRIQLHYDD